MRPRRSSPPSLAEQVAAITARPYPVEQALRYARALANSDRLELSERDRLAPLVVLSCAIASQDCFFMRLVAHAVIADSPGVHLFPDGKLMRRGSRVEESRKDHWGRVLGHLDGKQVGLLDPREATSDPADRKAYVRAWIREDGGAFHPERRGFSVVLEPGAARGKKHIVPRADRALVDDVALKLRGAATLKVEWGWIGSTKPRWRQSIPVPCVARRVRTLVKGTIDEAEVRVRVALRRSDRRHVDNMAAAVAVYLLRYGHGALRGRGFRATVRDYFGRSDTGCRKSGCSAEQRDVRNLEAQAKCARTRWRTYHRGV